MISNEDKYTYAGSHIYNPSLPHFGYAYAET